MGARGPFAGDDPDRTDQDCGGKGLSQTMAARAITHELAAFAVHSHFTALPEKVRTETARAFLNWMGCVLGGCREPPVEIAVAAVGETGAAPQASIIGHRERTDVASAAFVNCLSSSALAFDDAHLATVTHPTGPVAAAIFALSEKHPFSGEDFVNALALGIEIQCRMSNVLLLPPSNSNLGFYVTGLTGPIGTAVALGRLLRLDEPSMRWAIGLAATQASGFRATHGTMAAGFVPAHAARSGVFAALLAAKGFTCSDQALEAERGFVDVFSSDANLARAVDGLGQQFELLANGYKPYPCGIVIHPTIDACLEIAKQIGPGIELAHVRLEVHPLALTLTGLRAPSTPLQAQTSLFHWVAAALLCRSAGLAEMRQECIEDPAIVALRGRIEALACPALRPDEAVAQVTLTTGFTASVHVEHARGSADRPMTDDELDNKFRAQARLSLSVPTTDKLLGVCRNVSALGNVGREISDAWAT
jgi:2-methylcitrate dehydratase PrpD